MIDTPAKSWQRWPAGMQSLRNWTKQKTNLLAAGFILIFLVTGILTLPHYGLTWDEGLGNLFFGERYLHYFTSFNQKNLDFKAELSYNRSHALNLYLSPFRLIPQEFPAVADTLSAASMYLFSYTLGWLNPIDGFHLFTVVLAAIFLWALYRFLVPRIGPLEAFLAVVFLGTFPRFWGDMHFNVKDVPETIFIGLTILAFLSWLQTPRWRKAILTGFLGGLALGVKANAVFIPCIVLIGLVPWSTNLQEWKDLFARLKQQFLAYLTMGATAVGVSVVSWPFLYANPYQNLKAYWAYILSQGDRTAATGVNLDPIRQLFFSMPEIMLGALLVGIILACTRIKEPFWRILLAWLIFPVLRASLPGAVNFDGIRHFLEFVPAAAILAGYGLGRVSAWLSTRGISLMAARAAVTVLLVVNLFFIYQAYFPYLHVYYNSFSGGLAGARNGWLGPEAGDYWASSFRQGMTWLNQNAPQGSEIRGVPADWIVRLSAPLFLRPDIQVMPDESLPDFNVLNRSERPIYLMFAIRGGTYLDELTYCQTHKTPVYQILVDGVPILQIFQFGKQVQ